MSLVGKAMPARDDYNLILHLFLKGHLQTVNGIASMISMFMR